jgi:DNA-binding NarL/FixJ family response regulator
VTSGIIDVAVTAVLEGLRIGNAAMVDRLIEAPAGQRQMHLGSAAITECERAVLEGLATDLREKEIAARLCVSVRTIEDIVARLKAKAGVRTVAGLAACAGALGLCPQGG